MLPDRRVKDVQRSPYSTSACRSAVRQNLEEMQQGFPADGDDFKRGMIMWWTGTSSNIPDKWVLADGTQNAAPIGSGFNLIGKFILPTHTDSAVGAVEQATEVDPTESPHEHTYDLQRERIKVAMEMPIDSDANLTLHALSPGHAEHKHTVTVKEKTIKTSLESEHQHEILVEFDMALDGFGSALTGKENVRHTHQATLNNENPRLPPHTPAHIAAAIDPHGIHTHLTVPAFAGGSSGDIDGSDHDPPEDAGNTFLDTNTSLTDFGAGAGSQRNEANNDVNLLPHGADGGAGNITHVFHNHKISPDKEWPRIPDSHTHEYLEHEHGFVDVKAPVSATEHQHSYTHGHEPFDISFESGIHGHKPSALHRHTVLSYAEHHNHSIEIGPEQGQHVHTTGQPENIQLLPIERI
jgi:hypothetical protein